jgi:hypothetical protein
LIGTAPIFAVWPLNSCHAAQRMRRNSARYALRFVRHAAMNAPNIKRSIVSNALKPVTSALKNAGTWQRNNTYPPLPTIPPVMELLCPAEIVDSLLHIGTHQFYKRIQPCFESPLLKGQSSALARDSGEGPSLSSAARSVE